MPGFPIRTSSDQRFIDNSPRLNAALHVLHRLSMPRHPPCALNNEHTTNKATTTKAAEDNVGVNTQNTKEQRNHTNHNPPPTHAQSTYQQQAHGLMLASTIQFSHNTPHNPNNQEVIQPDCSNSCGLYNQGTMPQTPNNAPSTFQNRHLTSATLVNQSSQLRCISTRLTYGGSKTFVYSTTSHTTKVRLKDTNWCHIYAP